MIVNKNFALSFQYAPMFRIVFSSLLVTLMIASSARNKTPAELIDTFSENKVTLDSLFKKFAK